MTRAKTPTVLTQASPLPGLVAFESLDAFVEAIEEDRASPYGNASGFLIPETLKSGGTAAVFSYADEYGEGGAEMYRPFPGAMLVLHEGIYRDQSRVNKFATKLNPAVDHYMFRLVDTGRISVRLNSETFDLGPGEGLAYRYMNQESDNLIVERDSYHRYAHFFFNDRGASHAASYLGINTPDVLRGLAIAEPSGPAAFPLQLSPTILGAFTASLWETKAKGVFQGALARLKFAELFCLLNGVENLELATSANRPSFQETRKLFEARSIIDANLDTPLNLNTLARRVGLNRRKLTEGFRIQFGRAVSEYQRERAMTLAFELLCETDFSLEEIASRCGYSHLSSFSRAFSLNFGKPPSSLRGGGEAN